MFSRRAAPRAQGDERSSGRPFSGAPFSLYRSGFIGPLSSPPRHVLRALRARERSNSLPVERSDNRSGEVRGYTEFHEYPLVRLNSFGELNSIENSLIRLSANFTYSSSISYPT